MSIKVEMFINLPYIIKLDKEKDYKFSFVFDDFEIFNLEMRFNDEENEEIYNEDYPPNSCNKIRIEAIYNNCNYLDYEEYIGPFDSNEDEFIVKLPYKDTYNIFNVVNKRLEEILNYLRNKSNMFWIEAIPIKPISYCFGNEIEFNFYSPNVQLFKNYRNTIKYTDYYMLSNSYEKINKVNDDTFNDFKDTNNNVEKFDLYLNKAEKCLYERCYEDFIIYCSISVESFIRRYIGKIEPKDDIVFNRISSSNYDYLDQYYNILLKYLKGRSLKELDKSAFTLLKRMYNLRNSIMHNGTIDEKVLTKVGLNCINFNECKKILESVKNTFLIISKL